MTSRFNLPHIDITARSTPRKYKGQGLPVRGTPRDRIAHGERVRDELRIALEAGVALKPTDARLPPSPGIYLEVELDRGKAPEVVEYASEGIRSGAVKIDDATGRKTISLFVPDHARPVIASIVDDYLHGELTIRENPPQKARVEAIETIRAAHIGTRWTDQRPIPADTQTPMWWGLWCYRDRVDQIQDACVRLNVRMAERDRWMLFPEVVIVPVLTSRATVELLMFATDAIAELRLANDTPTFFIDEVEGEQHEWVDALAERVVWPGNDAPAVCILDTGINRGHPLIEPALVPADMHALDEEAWGVDDHDRFGHGTSMAGLALHGDLTAALSDSEERALRHRLESVKLLPPGGFDPAQPQSYGILTQGAIALPEIEAAERTRVYCMAITNENITGKYASSWSAAIDQAAVGRMIGDEGADADRPKRLIFISGGNVPAKNDYASRLSQDEYPIEDPAQAWNAVTVGCCTDLVNITETGYAGWTPMAQAGELSPHSRTSAQWIHNIAPFKPEIVMEGGNRAVNPGQTEMITVDSLSLLTTGHDAAKPLVAFDATSAATAQAARMAARLHAEHPNYWPETIRALMVHSAEWTEPMKASVDAASAKRDRYPLIRRFGYGVPDFDRANASARNHLAMVAQAEIQPYQFAGGREFNECHYYDLPIPPHMLEELNNEPVELKVTLSYFIDPNPGLSANVDAQRYQSHGLRFSLQRRSESPHRFRRRVNASERTKGAPRERFEAADPRWTLGEDSVSAGSLHCDIWKGYAIELLRRNMLCISPVNGWCRKRADKGICDRMTRYALVVSFKTLNVDLNIYTPIETAVRTPIQVETPI